MRFLLLSFAILSSFSCHALADDGVQNAREAVAATEQRVNRLKEVADAVPGSVLQQAEIELSEARIRLAELEGRQQAVVDGLTALVEPRQQEFERLHQVVGAVPERSIHQARIRLAEARIRLELQTVAAVRQQELARIEEAEGVAAVPKATVNEARKALELARSRIRLVTAAADEEAPAHPEEASDGIKDLLKEHLAIVTEIRALAEEAYRAGAAGLDQLHEAQTAVLAAQLELADSKEERLKVRQEMLQEAEEWAKTVAELAKASETTKTDVLKAKAYHLRARIDLEKEKAADHLSDHHH